MIMAMTAETFQDVENDSDPLAANGYFALRERIGNSVKLPSPATRTVHPRVSRVSERQVSTRTIVRKYCCKRIASVFTVLLSAKPDYTLRHSFG